MLYRTAQIYRCSKGWVSVQLTCWLQDVPTVHKSCCQWTECSFLYHTLSPKVFQRIWRYDRNTSPGPPHARPSESSLPTELHNQLSESISGKLLGVLVLMSISDLNAVHPHDVSGKIHTSVGVWNFGKVFPWWINPGFHCRGQIVWWGVAWERSCASSGPW